MGKSESALRLVVYTAGGVACLIAAVYYLNIFVCSSLGQRLFPCQRACTMGPQPKSVPAMAVPLPEKQVVPVVCPPSQQVQPISERSHAEREHHTPPLPPPPGTTASPPPPMRRVDCNDKIDIVRFVEPTVSPLGQGDVAKKPTILILTPLKDAAKHLDDYVNRLLQMSSIDLSRISLGILDSFDHTSETRSPTMSKLVTLLPRLRPVLRRITLVRHDFVTGIPGDGDRRHDEDAQLRRRAALARSRNRLLVSALGDEVRRRGWKRRDDGDITRDFGRRVETGCGCGWGHPIDTCTT